MSSFWPFSKYPSALASASKKNQNQKESAVGFFKQDDSIKALTLAVHEWDMRGGMLQPLMLSYYFMAMQVNK